MDLSDMMKEASVIDHDWYGKPSFDPEAHNIRKRHNITPELEVQWGTGPGLVDLNEPAGVVEREIPEDYPAPGVDKVILFARDRMNRGLMGKSLRAALRERFGDEILKASKEALAEQFELEGIAGCIAVDGRGYKSCKEAMEAASHSPYKRAIKYAIGCQCGTPHLMPKKHTGRVGGMVESSGNAMDDFLASDSDTGMEMVSHCRSTMLPIVSWRDDLDPSWADETFIDIKNIVSLPEDVNEEIREKRESGKISSNICHIREIFRRASDLRDASDEAKYAGVVDNRDFVIHPLEDVLDIDDVPVADLEVDPVNYALQQEVEPVDSLESTIFDDDLDVDPDMGDLDLAGTPDMSQIPVELTDESNEKELLFDDVESPAESLHVDPSASEMSADVAAFSPLDDIEMAQFHEEEFDGIGDIELDEQGESMEEVGVDMTPDMRI